MSAATGASAGALTGRATGALVASSALTLAAAYSKSRALLAQGKATAAANRTNAALARLAAREEVSRGREQSRDAAAAQRLLIGRQRAGAASGGVAVDVGSALDIQVDTAGIGAIERERIETNALKRALGFRIEAASSSAAARAAEAAADSAAFNTLLVGGAQVARDITAFRESRPRPLSTRRLAPSPTSPRDVGRRAGGRGLGGLSEF
jgi:hypothetical protein